MNDLGSRADTPPFDFHLGAKLLVVTSGPLASIAIIGITSVLPQIAQALEPGPRTMMTKQLVGVVGLAMAIGSPLAGWLVGRLTPRLFLLGVSLLYVAAGTAGLYVGDIAVLLASRFFVGLAAAGLVIMTISIINTRLDGTERAKWMGIQVGLAMISALAIHPVAGGLGEFGWRLPFLLFLLGLPLVFVALVKMEGRVPPRRDEPAPKAASGRLLSWYPWRFAALALLIGSTTYLPVVYAPFLMREMGVTSPTLIGLVLTGDSVLGALFALAYGRSRRWFNSPQTFIFSFAFTGAGALMAGLAPSLPLVIVGLLVFGIGMGWLVPNLVTSLATYVSADQQAPAAGLTKAFHYVASPACILAIEPIAALYGPQSAMWAVVLISSIMLVCYGSRVWKGSRATAMERERS